MKVLSYVGGILVRPRETLARLVRDDRAPVWPVVALLVLAAAITAPVALLQEALLVAVSVPRGAAAVGEWLARWALVPVAALVVLWAVAAVALRARTRRWDRQRTAALGVAAAYLYVPSFVTVVASKLLAVAGVSLRFAPHLPVFGVDASSLARLGLEFAWSAALVPWLVRAAHEDRLPRPPKSAPLVPAPRARALAAAATAFFGLVCLAGAAAAAREMATTYPLVRPVLRGDLAPAVDLSVLDARGGRIRLADLRGKVVLLDFWATWCAPCIRSLPDLDRLYRAHGAEGLVVLAVNRDTGSGRTDAVRLFVAEHGLSFPVALDNGPAAVAYRVLRLPTSFLVDRAGVVRGAYVGVVDAADLETEVRALLAEKLPEPSFPTVNAH